jgi:hypothetical protein
MNPYRATPPATAPAPSVICDHGANRKACPICFKFEKPAIPAGATVAQQESPVNQIVQHGMPQGVGVGGYQARPSPPASLSNDKLWEPPPRPQLVDLVPRRPAT